TKFGSGKLWRPSDLGADLALWLDAEDTDSITLNGSTVSQWSDKSGNGRNATQATATNQPTYLPTGFNGKPTLETDGNDVLELGATSLGRNVSGITCAIVGVHPSGLTFASNANELYISTGSSITSTRFAFTPNPTASTANRYAIAGRRLDGDPYQTVSSSTDSLANRGNQWIRVGQAAYSDGVANHWTDGTQDLTAEPFQTAGVTSDTDPLRTSIFGGVNELPAGSQLCEIVLTHSTMTPADRQRLEGYLAWKWNLVGNLPADHPYKTQPPFVIDPEAQKYLRAVEAADGQALEEGVRLAVNDFVVGCKEDGIWDAIKASVILAGARTLGGALIPLTGAAPTNFNFVAGDYNRATGLKGNGSTKYLDSNRNNNADPQNSKHLAIYQTSLATQTSLLVATTNVPGRSALITFIPEGFEVRINSSTNTVENGNVVGFAGGVRTSSTQTSARIGGTDFPDTVTSEPPLNENIGVFASVGGGAPTNARLSFYSIGESLDLALLDARVSTLMTAIGAAIP
ncbi:MAG: hypothetical protein ACO3QM_06535, partial [Candidatus Nanopelagicaceae bacterium]